MVPKSTEPLGWNNRRVAHEDSVGKLYLFTKSFNELKNNSGLIFGDLLSKTEKRDSVTYTQPLQDIIDGTPHSNDPILSYLFNIGDVEKPTAEQILDFYEEDAYKQMRGQAFVDLCFILNSPGRAQTFADACGKTFDVLEAYNASSASNALAFPSAVFKTFCIETKLAMVETFSAKSTEPIAKLVESGELTTLLSGFFFADKSCSLDTLLTLWYRGYKWDAYILVSYMYPDSVVATVLRNLFQQNLDAISIGTVMCRDFIVNANCSNDCWKLFDTTYLNTIDPIMFYRAIKLDAVRNSKNPDNILKLKNRSFLREYFHAALMHAAHRFESKSASIILKDLMGSEHIEGLREVYMEMFPGMRSIFFERCYNIFCDAFEMLTHIGGFIKSKRCLQIDGYTNGIAGHLLDDWIRKGYFEMPSGVEAEAPKVIFDILSSLVANQVSDLPSQNEVSLALFTNVALGLAIDVFNSSEQAVLNNYAATWRNSRVSSGVINSINAELLAKLPCDSKDPVLAKFCRRFRNIVEESIVPGIDRTHLVSSSCKSSSNGNIPAVKELLATQGIPQNNYGNVSHPNSLRVSQKTTDATQDSLVLRKNIVASRNTTTADRVNVNVGVTTNEKDRRPMVSPTTQNTYQQSGLEGSKRSVDAYLPIPSPVLSKGAVHLGVNLPTDPSEPNASISPEPKTAEINAEVPIMGENGDVESASQLNASRSVTPNELDPGEALSLQQENDIQHCDLECEPITNTSSCGDELGSLEASTSEAMDSISNSSARFLARKHGLNVHAANNVDGTIINNPTDFKSESNGIVDSVLPGYETFCSGVNDASCSSSSANLAQIVQVDHVDVSVCDSGLELITTEIIDVVTEVQECPMETKNNRNTVSNDKQEGYVRVDQDISYISSPEVDGLLNDHLTFTAANLESNSLSDEKSVEIPEPMADHEMNNLVGSCESAKDSVVSPEALDDIVAGQTSPKFSRKEELIDLPVSSDAVPSQGELFSSPNIPDNNVLESLLDSTSPSLSLASGDAAKTETIDERGENIATVSSAVISETVSVEVVTATDSSLLSNVTEQGYNGSENSSGNVHVADIPSDNFVTGGFEDGGCLTSTSANTGSCSFTATPFGNGGGRGNFDDSNGPGNYDRGNGRKNDGGYGNGNYRNRGGDSRGGRGDSRSGQKNTRGARGNARP